MNLTIEALEATSNEAGMHALIAGFTGVAGSSENTLHYYKDVASGPDGNVWKTAVLVDGLVPGYLVNLDDGTNLVINLSGDAMQEISQENGWTRVGIPGEWKNRVAEMATQVKENFDLKILLAVAAHAMLIVQEEPDDSGE